MLPLSPAPRCPWPGRLRVAVRCLESVCLMRLASVPAPARRTAAPASLCHPPAWQAPPSGLLSLCCFSLKKVAEVADSRMLSEGQGPGMSGRGGAVPSRTDGRRAGCVVGTALPTVPGHPCIPTGRAQRQARVGGRERAGLRASSFSPPRSSWCLGSAWWVLSLGEGAVGGA